MTQPSGSALVEENSSASRYFCREFTHGEKNKHLPRMELHIIGDIERGRV